MKSLGICVGATTLSAVQVEHEGEKVQWTALRVQPHNGNPRQAFLDTITKLSIETFDRIAVTGRKFRNSVNLTSLPEPEAVEEAVRVGAFVNVVFAEE